MADERLAAWLAEASSERTTPPTKEPETVCVVVLGEHEMTVVWTGSPPAFPPDMMRELGYCALTRAARKAAQCAQLLSADAASGDAVTAGGAPAISGDGASCDVGGGYPGTADNDSGSPK